MKLSTITGAAILFAAASASADSCRQAQTTDFNYLAGPKKTVIFTNAAKALKVKPYTWKRVFFTPGAGQFKGQICADSWNVNAVQIGQPEECEKSEAFITVTGNAAGTASVALTQGNDITTTVSTSQSTTHSAGLDVNLEMSVGAFFLFAGAKTSVTTHVGYDFTTGKDTSTTESDPQTTTVTRTITGVGNGNTCQIAVEQATCRFRSQAYIPLVLSGWLGFEFDKAIKVRIDRPALKTWYVDVAKIAKAPHRSQMLPLSVEGSVVTKGNTDASCHGPHGEVHPSKVTGVKKAAPKKAPAKKPAAPRKKGGKKARSELPAVEEEQVEIAARDEAFDWDRITAADLYTRDEIRDQIVDGVAGQ
ncbi:hypothetical protein HDU87_006490 [Geranomyces variabilis]|uniref:Uncharacterized protein n=1 Tax=Geranomyces variabilis TaxID=109894 RepID=A0AAD5TGK9_9FUNG|nr:hypothetical protein HDU87_006490 [Geranomyces variabilis]